MKKITCVFILIFNLIGCQKSADPILLKGVYKSGNIENVYPVIMVTKEGQVTDLGVIKNFLQFRGLQGDFVFDSSSISAVSNLLTLTIDQYNNVSILAGSSTNPVAGEIINQTPAQILIAGNDSIAAGISIDAGSRCDTLNITSVIPAKTYYMRPLGFYSFYKYRPMFPVKIKNQGLILPLLRYVVSCTNGSTQYCYKYIIDEWNTFNSSIIAQLQTGDTILYQAKEVVLLKQ